MKHKPKNPKFANSSAGQAGDDQGLPARSDADSESVKELVDEGQPFEADVIEGVEDASEHPERPVRTRELPEDDIPEEYRDDGNDV